MAPAPARSVSPFEQGILSDREAAYPPSCASSARPPAALESSETLTEDSLLELEEVSGDGRASMAMLDTASGDDTWHTVGPPKAAASAKAPSLPPGLVPTLAIAPKTYELPVPQDQAEYMA